MKFFTMMSLGILSFIAISAAQPAPGSKTSAECDTLLQPLKEIHSALEPLEQIRDDLSSLVTLPNSGVLAETKCEATHGDGTPGDCGELYNTGHTKSGVYTVYLYNSGMPVPISVYCDMETDGGGWLVFQRRQDGLENFYRNWQSYTQGFGNITGEFWLGNALLHTITDNKAHELRVDMQDHEGNSSFAKYERFYVGSQRTAFTLIISHYSGTAGDSLSMHNGAQFSTKDRDNDNQRFSCSNRFKGAWWFDACHYSNLNGAYQATGQHNGTSYADHVTWETWHGYYYSLKFSEMKIRPLNF